MRQANKKINTTKEITTTEKHTQKTGWRKYAQKYLTALFATVIIMIIAWMVKENYGSIQTITIFILGVLTFATVLLQKWLKPKIGTWTSWILITLLAFLFLYVVVLTTPQCYNYALQEPMTCSNKEALGLSGSLLLLPVVAALIYFPFKYFIKTSKFTFKRMKKQVTGKLPDEDKLEKNKQLTKLAKTKKDKQKEKTETILKNKTMLEQQDSKKSWYRKNKNN